MWGIEANLGSVRNLLGLGPPRGAAVPFETPALRMARVCEDEHDGLIAILRDFANNGSRYIVPWRDLQSVVTMTERDMALHQAVAENQATTPEKMRAVVRDLALTGAFGAEAQSRAAAEQHAGTPQVVDTELMLIHTLLRGCGVDCSINAGRWNARRARAAVAAVAARMGVSGKEIYRRISEFALLLQPIGLVVAEGNLRTGWLRMLHGEIKDFGQELSTRAKTMPPDASAELGAIAISAARTAELSEFVLKALDQAVVDLSGTIRRWQEEAPVLRQAIERLAMTLDEWPGLMKGVHDALRGPPQSLLMELRSLRSIAPELPAQQTPGSAAAAHPAALAYSAIHASRA